MGKSVLLSFDVEEFDLPKEFNINIGEEEMYGVSHKGLLEITKLIEKMKVKTTFFTTATFALRHPKTIKYLSENHEIASHGYAHSDSYLNGDFSRAKKARQILEKITKSNVLGFRAPRFKIKKIEKLKEHGFSYDSSIHPTIAPGKYFNIRQKRKVHKIGEITEIPLSTLPAFPFLRAPINWYMFRHFPEIYTRSFARINYTVSDYLTLIFHPWEFIDISGYKLPMHFKKNSGQFMLKNLKKYIIWCKNKNYKFKTFSQYQNLITN